MIDVMMFLLVFFVLISVNVIPALGIKTLLPQSSQAQSLKTPTRQVVVTIARDGTVLVDGKATTPGGLASAVMALLAPGQKPSVVINGDKGAEVQRLVDVMDELKSGGISAIALAARERH